MRMQEMAPTLAEWGCDEALWGEIRNKQALLDLAEAGDEKKGRERIEFLRRVTSGEGDNMKPSAPRMPNHGPFSLSGEAPEGVDVDNVADILAKRVEAKKERDFDTADALQSELLAMGIYIDDRKRTWEAAKAGSGGIKLKGDAPEGVDVAVVEDLLAKRREAKKAKDFDAADAIQAELLAMNVWIDDKKRTWEARKKPTPAYRLEGDAPAGVDMAAVKDILGKRIEAKKTRDFDAADELQKELLNMGIYVNDKLRTYQEANWVKAKAAEEAAPAEPAAAAEEAPAAE